MDSRRNLPKLVFLPVYKELYLLVLDSLSRAFYIKLERIETLFFQY